MADETLRELIRAEASTYFAEQATYRSDECIAEEERMATELAERINQKLLGEDDGISATPEGDFYWRLNHLEALEATVRRWTERRNGEAQLPVSAEMDFRLILAALDGGRHSG